MNNTLEDVGVERPAADTAVVTFTGEHDLATRDAVGVLLGSLVEENDLVVVDFSEAKFVDSATIHTLFTVDSAARERGAKLRLQLGTAAVVEKAFELCGVLERLECASSRDEALPNGRVST